MYLYGDTDPLYRRNFEFFAEHGMDAAGGAVEYVVFVQVVGAPASCALSLCRAMGMRKIQSMAACDASATQPPSANG